MELPRELSGTTSSWASFLTALVCPLRGFRAGCSTHGCLWPLHTHPDEPSSPCCLHGCSPRIPPPHGRALGGCELVGAAHSALGARSPHTFLSCSSPARCRVTAELPWQHFGVPCTMILISQYLLQRFPGKKKPSPKPVSTPAPSFQQRCRCSHLPPAAGKGLYNCHQYNYYVLGLHPLPAAEQVDFGLCLHFIPLSGEAGGSQAAVLGSGTHCSTPK